jgi:hypothetical protein
MKGQGHSDPEEMRARLLQTLYFQTEESNVMLWIITAMNMRIMVYYLLICDALQSGRKLPRFEKLCKSLHRKVINVCQDARPHMPKTVLTFICLRATLSYDLRNEPSDRDVRTRSATSRVDLGTRYVTVCVVSLVARRSGGKRDNDNKSYTMRRMVLYYRVERV